MPLLFSKLPHPNEWVASIQRQGRIKGIKISFRQVDAGTESESCYDFSDLLKDQNMQNHMLLKVSTSMRDAWIRK